jgi:4-carboxymuconolactone decarboxylase
VLIQSIPYAGFPCVAEAIEATVAVLRERGLVDDATKTAKDRGML